LFAAWLFNEPAGTRVLNRAHPGGYTTTSGTPTRIVTEHGPALAFRHASSQYASANETVPKGPITIVARIRRPVSSTYAFFCTQRLTNGSQSAFQFWLNGSSGDKKLYFLNGTHSSVASTATITSSTAWYQIAVAYDDISRVRFYINGKLDSTRTLTTSATWPRTNLLLQRDTASSSNYASADLEYVYIFRRELTGIEIARLYADPYQIFATRPRTSALVSPTVVHDLAGSIAAASTATGNLALVRRNLWSNADLEAGIYDWEAVRACAISWSDGKAWQGTYSLQMVPEDSGWELRSYVKPIEAETEYTFSIYAFPGADMKDTGLLSFYDQDDNLIDTQSYGPIPGGVWSRIYGTFTTGVGDTGLKVLITSGADAETVYYDGAKLERGSTVSDWSNYIGWNRELEGAIAAASTLTGNAIRVRALAGSIAAASALAGDLMAVRGLAGSIVGTSTLTGDLTVETGGVVWDLAGAIAAQADLAGDLRVTRELAGQIAASAALVADLAVDRALEGAIAASSMLTGAINLRQALAGSIVGASSLTGTLALTHALAGAITAQAELLGDLQIEGAALELEGAITAHANLSGSLSVVRALAGSVEAHAGVAGSLAVVRALAGAIEAQATLLGELEILAGQVQLEGSITAAGTLTGDLTVNRALEGAIGAASEVLGGLTLLAGLSGSIVGRATLVGQLRLLSEMIGDVIDPDLVSLTPWYGLNSAAVVLDFVESGPDFLPLSLTPTYDLLSLTEKANVT